MKYFNFFGLPEVVQDLIVHEIVHNSVPNDRIQLARTCKYMNEAVKRAKLKKIVEKLEITWLFEVITFRFDLKTLYSFLPSPKIFANICQILQQIQVEELTVNIGAIKTGEAQQSNLFYHLFEATKFVTELNIQNSTISNEFPELYNKLKHVEFMFFFRSIKVFKSLSHYPSRMRLSFEEDYDSSVLHNLTKKTVNNPLSSLIFDSCIHVKNLQRFLRTTRFKNGCEIYCNVKNSEGENNHIFLTFIDDEQGFEIETFPTKSSLIVANQKYDGEEKRILTLSVVKKKDCGYNHDNPPLRVPFNVTKKTHERVKDNHWIDINFPGDHVHVRYSNKMLESIFPRNDYSSAQERVTFINATVGCRISIIKVEELAETVQKLENGRIPVSDPLFGNNRKRGPPSFFEDES